MYCYFNHRYKRTGTLWEGRFKSCVVDDDNYLLICQRYIELNPVRANMVSHPEEYKWSSYCANGLGQNVTLCTPHPIYTHLKNVVVHIEICFVAIWMILRSVKYAMHQIRVWPWAIKHLSMKLKNYQVGE